jgi:hypothetical protein
MNLPHFIVRLIESNSDNHICIEKSHDNLKHCVVCDKNLCLTEQYYIIDSTIIGNFLSNRVCSILCQETFILQNL